MITTSNSPVKGSGIPNQLLGVRPHTIAISGPSRVRTELRHLFIVPSLAPHPVHPNGESSGHSDLGNLPPPPHRQVKILTPPFRVAAHRDLGGLLSTKANDVRAPTPGCVCNRCASGHCSASCSKACVNS